MSHLSDIILFDMPVYLPIAEMSANGVELIFLGMIVGFFSGLFGVGGGFLSLPFLVFVGIPPTVAVTTQGCQIVASSSAATLSEWKRGRIDVKLALHMMAGSFGGLIVGVGIFALLQMLGQIDFAIKATYTVLLAGIGASMAWEIVSSLLRRHASPGARIRKNRIFLWLKVLPYQTEYPASGIRVSMLGPIGIGFLGGVMVAVLGSGGSFMLVPAMIYFLGIPALMVTGTSLLQLLVTATISCLLHSLTTQTIDLVLGTILIAGSVVGAILGLRASRYIKGLPAHLLLAVLIILVALRMGYDLMIEPADHFSLVMDR